MNYQFNGTVDMEKKMSAIGKRCPWLEKDVGMEGKDAEVRKKISV